MRKIAVTYYQGEPWVAISEQNPDKDWGRESIDCIEALCCYPLQLSPMSAANLENVLSFPNSDPITQKIQQLLFEFFLRGVEIGMKEASNPLMQEPFISDGVIPRG
jgi:hypothetical protein